MEYKKIIPCLDMKDGKVVKGINFEGLRMVGDPVEMGAKYCRDGADELVYLDISATVEGRKTFIDLVGTITAVIDIPLTVGGGIASVEDARRLIDAGASKVSVNTAAILRPDLINELVKNFGSEAVTVAIDAVEEDGKWICVTHGGNKSAGLDLFEWAAECERRGAGAILFTSKSHDGTKAGYPVEAYARLKDFVKIPVIASGGAGSREDILDVLVKGKADAALAASVFHFGEIEIPALKEMLADHGIKVRCKPSFNFSDLDSAKNAGGLVPAIVQDARTLKVLMLGYMNEEAFDKTVHTGLVTFWSRSRNTLWTKGETSGNYLHLVRMHKDCDNDTLLIKAIPDGPTCHTGSLSCFDTADSEGFIRLLQSIVQGRHQEMPEESYTTYLYKKGVNKMAQKVGEEAVETVIEAVDHNLDRFIYESSDLIYHLLVLMEGMGITISTLEEELARRHK